MIARKIRNLVERRLLQAPAVVLLGPRQVGKTTLAGTIAAQHPRALMLDLERESDRAALQRPELFFAAHRDRLLVLDEVQFAPQLFTALRPEIDADRRTGRFLLLGSASGDLCDSPASRLQAEWPASNSRRCSQPSCKSPT